MTTDSYNFIYNNYNYNYNFGDLERSHYTVKKITKITKITKPTINKLTDKFIVIYYTNKKDIHTSLIKSLDNLVNEGIDISLIIFHTSVINYNITYNWIQYVSINSHTGFNKNILNYLKNSNILLYDNNNDNNNDYNIFPVKYFIKNLKPVLLMNSNIVDNENIHLNFLQKILKFSALLTTNIKYDVLILTTYDYCNTGYRYYNSLLKNNIKAHMIKIYSHTSFNYGDQCPYLFKNKSHLVKNKNKNKNTKIIKETVPYYHTKISKSFLNDLIKLHIQKSNAIYLHAGTYIELENFDYKNKYIISGVGGHYYRRQPKNYCNFFNTFINGSLIQCPDLLNLGLKNEHLIYYGIDTELILPEYSFNIPNKLVIGHFASSTKTKGSDVIISAINEIVSKYPEKFEYIGYKSSTVAEHEKIWKDNIARMKLCDIYIETCKPYLNAYGTFTEYNNTTFGEWGNTCLEASACGCIVITNSLTTDYYKKEYTTEYPLLIANNREEIINHLENINNISFDEVLELKKKFRKWVEENHSLKVTGKRFYDKLLSDFFSRKRRLFSSRR